MAWTADRRDRARLLAWLLAAFALSACRDPRWLGGAALGSLLLLRRGALRHLGRTLRTVVPLTAALSLASLGWVRLLDGAWPPIAPFLTLALRSGLIGFLTFATLGRVALLRALAPCPIPSRLLVVALAQIHALRLLATESRDGLRSRLPRRPGALDLLRGAGGLTAALFTLSARNAREIGEAMRSRGF
jgi:cobalt/nickel transport system permease protein